MAYDVLQTLDDIILHDEGGWKFTDDPNDPGGATYGGMTYKTFATTKIGGLTAAEFKARALANNTNLQRDIKLAYLLLFGSPFQFEKSEWKFWPVYSVLSAAINLGVGEAVELVQLTVNKLMHSSYVAVDGKIGDKTFAALDRCGVEFGAVNVTAAFRQIWAKKYIDLVQANCDAWDAYLTKVLALKPTESDALAGNDVHDIAIEQLRPPSSKRWKYLEGWLNRVI